ALLLVVADERNQAGIARVDERGKDRRLRDVTEPHHGVTDGARILATARALACHTLCLRRETSPPGPQVTRAPVRSADSSQEDGRRPLAESGARRRFRFRQGSADLEPPHGE